MALAEIGGMTLICSGIFALAAEHGWPVHTSWQPMLLAVLTGMTIAVYKTIDGLGVRHGPTPFSFAAWLVLLDGATFAILARYWRGPGLWTTVRLS